MNKRGAAIVNIIAPPVFILGIFLCLWAIYLVFTNTKLSDEIDKITKNNIKMESEAKNIEKQIEDIDAIASFRTIAEKTKNDMKNAIDKEKKDFFEEDKKEEERSEIIKKYINIKEQKKISPTVEEKLTNYLLGKTLLNDLKFDLSQKTDKIRGKYLEISDKELETKIQEITQTYQRAIKKEALGRPGISYTNIIEYLDGTTNLLQNLKYQYEKQDNAISNSLKQVKTVEAELQQIDEKITKNFQTLENNNLKEICEYVLATVEKVNTVNKFITDKTERINNITKNIEDEKKELEGEISKLRNTLESLRIVGILKKDIFIYGGNVIREDFTNNIVVVSYGSIDGLKKGHIFYVFDFFPIGGYRWKGLIEIIEVEKTQAKAKILYENFKNNPIKTGDYLSSPFFKRGSKIRIYLYGRIEKATFGFSTQELKEHLESIGVIVQKSFDLYTDFVIFGLDKIGLERKKDKQWNDIIELGIPTIQLQDLLPLLGGYIKVLK